MGENSRTKNSIFNISSNIIIYLTKTLLAFLARTVFINILGETYLGVNGLLTNILSMLSLAELGIGTAISFSLYKPLAEKDEKQISALMTFYKKCYFIIGIVIAIIGIVIFFFLRFIIDEYDSIPKLNIIYLLYLINTVSTYFISYKEILITADQKAYKLTKINLLFTVLLYGFQIIILLITKDFIIYLITHFIVQLMQRIVVNRYIGTVYKNIDYNSKEKIEENSMKKIKSNVKAMFFHKIGEYCINGTDNIIISSFIDIVTVGFYSNYTMITTTVNSLIIMIYNSVTASVGNLLSKDDAKKSVAVFRKIDFIAFILYSFCGIAMYAGLNKLIEVWGIGNQYILDDITVALIVFNFFFTGTRVANGIIKTAAGINEADKFVPLVQSVINLVVSIVGAIYFGLNGIIVGTIMSSLAPNIYRPYVVYKYVFKESIKSYYIMYIKYILSFLISMWITNKFMMIVNFSNSIIELFVLVIGAVCIHTIICIVFFIKDINLKEYVTLLANAKK